MKLALACLAILAAPLHAEGIAFDKTVDEIQAAPDANLVVAEFAFTNKGSQASSIAKTDPGCSCVKVEVSGGKLRYEPGESGVVRATFDMGNFTGLVEKNVVIWIDKDAPEKPSQILKVRVHIPVLVELEPKTLKWEIDGDGAPQTIHVTMKGDKPIKVLSVDCPPESFTQQIKTLEEGSKYDVVVTPTSVAAPALAVLRIETDCAIAKHKTQQAFAVIRKPLASAPPPAKP